jgi:NADPH-dependent curcumin reductase CurA
VVGIAGSDKKNEYLEHELWVDRTINYKTAGDMKQALKEASPKGVDIYFDNVGGDVSDAVMPFINKAARIIICGQISLYNLERPVQQFPWRRTGLSPALAGRHGR